MCSSIIAPQKVNTSRIQKTEKDLHNNNYTYKEDIGYFLNLPYFINTKMHKEEAEGSKNFQILHKFGVTQHLAPPFYRCTKSLTTP